MKPIEDMSDDELLEEFTEVVKRNHYEPGPTVHMPYHHQELRQAILARMKDNRPDRDYYGRD